MHRPNQERWRMDFIRIGAIDVNGEEGVLCDYIEGAARTGEERRGVARNVS